jgi:hypothetical protein
MFAFTSLALLALAAIARADTGDLHVDTPVSSATQCQSITFTISGSVTGPFHAFIVDSTNPCGDSIAEILNISGSTFTYTPKADVVGKSVQIALENNDGTAEGWSGAFSVAAGDDSCETSSTPAATTPAAVAHTTTSRASVASVSAPVNAGSDNTSGTVSDDTSGASRAAVGLSGILALVGAAVVSFAL